METSVRLAAASMALLMTTVSVTAEALSSCASGASDVCYAVGVPTTTASQTTGNMYIQLSAPTTYSWVGLGMGASAMAGANMFIVYTDGNGNVTVSSRQGKGNVTPNYSAATASDITLLSGSGVNDGTMVANILCANCKAWDGGSLSTTSTGVPMIGAWKAGAALDSTDLSQSIQYHDGHASFDLDLTQATVASDSNPFSAAAATPTTTPTAGASGTSGVTVNARPDPKIIWAHGLGMALVFGVFYPVASALMPLLGKWQLHAGVQIVTWLGMWAFFGLGVYGARVRSLLFNNNHTLLGTVVVCLLAVQPVLGQLHHKHFVKTGGRGIISYAHIWWGRSFLVLGAINGGLGLQLSRSKQSLIIAYSVITVFFYLLYAGVKVLATMRKGRRVHGARKFSAGTGHSAEHGDDDVPMNAYRHIQSGKQ